MKTRFLATLAVASLTLAACSSGNGDEADSSDAASSVDADEAAVALLPEDVAATGVLTIGTDGDYPPNEFKDDDGNPAGWGIDLAAAIAGKLGLEPEFEILSFDSIIPRIQEGVLNLGASSFTDTLERQDSVDFVNYLNAGSLWAAGVDEDVDPDDACGLTIAVQATTVQHLTELPARDQECQDAGKPAIEILPFDGQSQAASAVVSGRAAAFSADLPVTGDTVANSGDQLKVVGEVFDAAPYGFAVQKDSGMAEAIQAALQSLIDDGTYLEILTSVGIESGAVDTATINAGEE